MTEQKFNDYAKFVDITTSVASKNTDKLQDRLGRLTGTTSHKGDGSERYEEMQVARLMTSVIGMMAESGEFADCLLYTSPSPRDGLLSRMPSSA